MTVYEKITLLRTQYDMTQIQFANIAGVSDKAVSTWELGVREPRMGAIYKICSHFNLDINRFIDDDMGLEDCYIKQDELPSNVVPLDIPTMKRVPILGRIACGRPVIAQEYIEGYVYTDLNGGHEYFALRAQGDSMNAARINDGDIVIVRKQDTADNGDLAVVMVGEENATLKRYRQDGRTITLSPQSTNPEHQPVILDAKRDKVKIIGVAVSMTTNLI